MNLHPTPKPYPTPPALDNGNHPSTASAGECGNCASRDTWLLHHVRLRCIHRRLCTSCVLRLHPASFCPTCFAIYDSGPPPPSRRLSCSNCASLTHSHCAPSHPPPPFPFLCPPCSDPSFSFFSLPAGPRVMDRKMATVLLCAARIAASSMAKAVMVAKVEAERRVKEAAVCRKRAREALEHMAVVAKRREVESSVEVSGSGNLGKAKKATAAVGVSPKNNNNNNNAQRRGGGEMNENGERRQLPQPQQQSWKISGSVSVSVKEEGMNSVVEN